SLDLVRKYPLARSRILLRLARRLVPRFTRGIAVLLFYLIWRLEVRRLLPMGISEARPLHAPLQGISLRRLVIAYSLRTGADARRSITCTGSFVPLFCNLRHSPKWAGPDVSCASSPWMTGCDATPPCDAGSYPFRFS